MNAKDTGENLTSFQALMNKLPKKKATDFLFATMELETRMN